MLIVVLRYLVPAMIVLRIVGVATATSTIGGVCFE